VSGEQHSQKAGAEAALDSAAIDLAFLLTRTDEVYPYPLTEGTAKPIAFSTEQEAALEEIALILDEVRDGYTGGVSQLPRRNARATERGKIQMPRACLMDRVSFVSLFVERSRRVGGTRGDGRKGRTDRQSLGADCAAVA